MKYNFSYVAFIIMGLLMQSSFVLAQSTKSTIEYKKQTRHALMLELPNTVEETEGTIVSKLKENGVNPQTQGSLFWKKNTQDGFYVFKNTKLPALGRQQLDLYFKVMKQSRSSKATKLYLMMATSEENFVSPNTDESLWEDAKQFLDGFAENVEAYSLEQEIKSKETKVKTAQTKMNNLQKDQKDLEDRILKFQKDLDLNKVKQTEMQAELEEQMRTLDSVKLKRKL
ncbi:MAG: hypothetical protein EOP48_15735 [Sphingobacteriales bacterium]|nr:MAG: hypothetical protein EOP48_15735 [Sphingobacteriales bacterium]